MRIDRLDLTAFGVFTNESIDLSQGNFHVIHGPNAAGKSTARAALSNLLYGFGRSSSYAFLHPLNRLQVGGVVADKDGKSLEIIRYKKDRSDLVDAKTGTVLNPGEWSAVLQGVGKEDFERIYTIGWNELLEGTASLVSGGGALGEALFASGLGIHDIRSVMQDLDDRAGKLFAPRAQKLIVNSSLKTAEAARKGASAMSVRPAKYDTTWREHEKAVAKRRKIAEERIAADRAIERLATLRGVLPQLLNRRKYLVAKSEIEDSGFVPPSSWAVRVNEALTTRGDAIREKSEADLRGAFAADKLKELIPDPNALNHADDVDSLAEGIHGYSQGLSDSAGLNQGRIDAEKEALSVLRGIIGESEAPTSLESAQSILRNRKALVKAREVWTKRDSSLSVAAAARLTSKQELDDAVAELNLLGESVDAEPLRSAFHAITRKGNLDAVLNSARVRTDRARAELVRAAGELGLSEDKIEGVFRNPLPTGDEVEDILGKIELLNTRANAEDDRIGNLNARMRGLEEELETLALEGDLPTEEELSLRRERREGLWSLIRGAWLNNEQVPTTTEYADSPTLASTFERATLTADEAADEMWRQADRTAARTNLQMQLRREESERTSALSSARESREEASTIYLTFKENWADQPLPDDPSVLRPWFRRIETLGSKNREWIDAKIAHRSAFREVRSASMELHSQLSSCGSIPESSGLKLDSYLELAESFLEASDKIVASRKSLEATIASRERRLPELEKSFGEAVDNEQKVAEKFRALCEPCGSEVLSPADAGILIERVDELEKQTSVISERSGRISGIDERSKRFENEAKRLFEAVFGTLLVDYLVDTRSLVARVKTARQIDAAREPLLASEASARAEAEAAVIALSGLDQQLQVLANEHGIPDIDALGALAERSLNLAALNDDIAACEELLAQQGGGMSIETLEDEAKELDFAAIDAEITRWQEERSGLVDDEAESELNERELDAQLREMNGSDGAATLLAESQYEIEKATEGAYEFARLSLAKLLASEAVRRFADAHQDPVLDRASQYLKILTSGEYETVGISRDSKNSALLSAVDSARLEWHVGELSSGIRDSLYLALRFAALDAAIERTGPMPIILDDVLVNLDENHSLAVLRCLQEIAVTTELLLFTHHKHVVDLAQEADNGDVPSIHHLSLSSRLT